MKKKFEAPSIDLVRIQVQDILTTSAVDTMNDDNVSGGNNGGFVYP